MNSVTGAAAAPEKTVWYGTPSQVLNLPHYLLLGAVFVALTFIGTSILRSMDAVPGLAVVIGLLLAAIPWAIGCWKWLVIANTRYELTTQRLRTRSGVLNKHLDELELYRVRDYKLQQPLYLRLFSLSTVVLETSDRSNPLLVLRAISHGEELREQVRTYVEEARLRKGVREVDLDRS
ncbi:MAG TPA: PH domain-containing protein [Steroidobacter sp.]|nr:PH domain-containing protein [Steroidobacter sp.]